jgi:hypothetical protein
VVAQQPAEVLRADQVGAALVTGQRDGALARGLVKAAMADEMKDVPWALIHGVLKITVGLPSHPAQLHQPVAFQVIQGRAQPALLLIDLQRITIAGTGNHAEDLQRWGHLQRLLGGEDLRVAHQRHAQAEVVLPGWVEQELPGQLGKFRWVYPQHQPQAAAFLAGTLRAGPKQLAHVAGQQSLEQQAAELLHRLLLPGGDPAYDG